MKMITKMGFLACVCLASFAQANEKEVKIEVKLLCPDSEELQNLRNAIPSHERANVDLQEWQQSFVAVMKKTIELVESGKVGSSLFYTAGVEDVKVETQN